jgi:hypothetical protein
MEKITVQLDAVRSMDCPRCGAPAGVVCKTPKGYEKADGKPHADRVTAFLKSPGFNIERYMKGVPRSVKVLKRGPLDGTMKAPVL